jgi:hypothetical protein
MADFSKQYCEIYDPEMEWGFDIEEIAEGIPKGHYKPIICEGFGFLGIGVRLDGTITVLIDDSDESRENAGAVRQVDYKRYISLHKSKVETNG